MMLRTMILTLFALLLTHHWAIAATITFDDVPSGTLVFGHYSALYGVGFGCIPGPSDFSICTGGSGALSRSYDGNVYALAIPSPLSAPNVVTMGSNPAIAGSFNQANGLIFASFATPVNTVSISAL